MPKRAGGGVSPVLKSVEGHSGAGYTKRARCSLCQSGWNRGNCISRPCRTDRGGSFLFAATLIQRDTEITEAAQASEL